MKFYRRDHSGFTVWHWHDNCSSGRMIRRRLDAELDKNKLLKTEKCFLCRTIDDEQPIDRQLQETNGSNR